MATRTMEEVLANVTIPAGQPVTPEPASCEPGTYIDSLRRIIAGHQTTRTGKRRIEGKLRQIYSSAYTDDIERAAVDADDKRALENCQKWVWLAVKLGDDYWDTTLDNFEIHNDRDIASRQAKVIADVKEYERNIRDEIQAGHGVLLFGPSGTGKDHLISCLAHTAIVRHGATVRWMRGSTFSIKSRAAMSDGTEEKLVAEYAKPLVLYISDPQPPVGQLTPFQATLLYEILDERNRKRRPTWVTLNVANRGDADGRLGTANVDRLIDRALALELTWPSYRSGGR